MVHPGRLTWNLLIKHLERKMIFQASMIMFHVNLRGCIRDCHHTCFVAILSTCTCTKHMLKKNNSYPQGSHSSHLPRDIREHHRSLKQYRKGYPDMLFSSQEGRVAIRLYSHIHNLSWFKLFLVDSSLKTGGFINSSLKFCIFPIFPPLGGIGRSRNTWKNTIEATQTQDVQIETLSR